MGFSWLPSAQVPACRAEGPTEGFWLANHCDIWTGNLPRSWTLLCDGHLPDTNTGGVGIWPSQVLSCSLPSPSIRVPFSRNGTNMFIVNFLCAILFYNNASVRSFGFTGNGARISACRLLERMVSTFRSSPMLKPKRGKKPWSVFSVWSLAAIDYCADEMHPGFSLFIQITLFFSLFWQQNKTKAGSTWNRSGMSTYCTRPKKKYCSVCRANSNFDGLLETGIGRDRVSFD